MSEDYWIQDAIKRRGSLRRFAEKHRAIGKDGDIDLRKAKAAAEKEREPERARRLREVNLARTLRKLRR
jgi:hypothetical protein